MDVTEQAPPRYERLYTPLDNDVDTEAAHQFSPIDSDRQNKELRALHPPNQILLFIMGEGGAQGFVNPKQIVTIFKIHYVTFFNEVRKYIVVNTEICLITGWYNASRPLIHTTARIVKFL